MFIIISGIKYNSFQWFSSQPGWRNRGERSKITNWKRLKKQKAPQFWANRDSMWGWAERTTEGMGTAPGRGRSLRWLEGKTAGDGDNLAGTPQGSSKNSPKFLASTFNLDAAEALGCGSTGSKACVCGWERICMCNKQDHRMLFGHFTLLSCHTSS